MDIGTEQDGSRTVKGLVYVRRRSWRTLNFFKRYISVCHKHKSLYILKRSCPSINFIDPSFLNTQLSVNNRELQPQSEFVPVYSHSDLKKQQ